MNKNKTVSKKPHETKEYIPTLKEVLIKKLLCSVFDEKESEAIATELSKDFLSGEDLSRLENKFEGKHKEFIQNLLSLIIYYSNEALKKIRLNSHFEAKEFLEEHLSVQKTENLYMVCLDKENRIVSFQLVQKGGNDAVFADVDYIVSKALSSNAPKVILAHNHVSGYMKYSMEDFYATEKLSAYFSAKGIVLMEHFVFSGGSCHGILHDLSGEDRWRFSPI